MQLVVSSEVDCRDTVLLSLNILLFNFSWSLRA